MYQQYQQPHQHPSQQGYHGGPQGPPANVDPIQARQLYRNELASLTFNSKPIITSLTIAAGENISVSKVIVQTIEERLRTAPSNQKLPTLYLIDSIIKNVGGPYLSQFGRTIVNLYLDAYAVVDNAAKSSFEKVLGTWPNWSTQLFPRDTIQRIERGVQSMRQKNQQSAMHVNPHFSNHPPQDMYNQGPNNMYANAPPAPSADSILLQDIQLLMLQKQQAAMLNPSDQANAKQVAILQQLETIVKTTQLTPDNANMIRQQLAQLWVPPPAPVAPVPPSSAFSQPGMPMPMPMGSLPPQISSAQVPPFQVGQSPTYAHLAPHTSIPSPQPMVAALPTSLPMHPNAPVSGSVLTTIAPPAPIPAVPNNLFASLMQSGLLGPNGTLASQLLQNTANMNRASQSPTVAAAEAPSTFERAEQSEQDQSVMSLGLIELTSQDIQRRRPAAIQAMYGTPPLQCNQCGYRCPKSADAQKKMDSHLDWHFRQNRRMKDKAKKSHSRSWLVGEEDWIHSREGDLSQSQQPVFFDFGSGINKTSKDEQALQEEIAVLREQIVSEASLVQSLRGGDGETTALAALNTITKGCSICKEKFIKVWNEAVEEWSYKNAVAVNKLIYHATCHADLVRSIQRNAAAAAEAAAQTSSPTVDGNDATMESPQTKKEDEDDESDVAKTKAEMAVLTLEQRSKFKPEESGTVKSEIKDEYDMTVKRENATSDTPVKEQQEQESQEDQDMAIAPELVSLKRKLEQDQEEAEEQVSKKTILAQQP